MQTTITARHFELTNAIRDHIEVACEKIAKYFDHIINVHFILSLENNRNKAEMILNVPKNNFISESSEKDMYLTIDNAIDKMENQIKKLKGKWTDHQKKGIKENSQYVYANLIESEQRKKIKIKRILAEVFTLDEALDNFENIAEPYLIFKNAETDRINVLIKRDEAHYKLIEP
ncbi:MAG TPA: ribosome-associated translation inhibitor RaiA [Candidatus Cloacimonetes bacterium]|nr:ribosome-associated translation inhibitor RaiA [Candidatus Cloacimonadota bacterium]